MVEKSFVTQARYIQRSQPRFQSSIDPVTGSVKYGRVIDIVNLVELLHIFTSVNEISISFDRPVL